ncbi:MAG: hypothetical protein IKF18_06620 [Erysipelotrichaceae bacterium]|nr:hypothetical protein [Erysipelotrichaceae bacterium]
MISSFRQLEVYLIRNRRSARAVLCGCEDAASLKALALAADNGLVTASFLIGDPEKTEKLCRENGIVFEQHELISETEEEAAVLTGIRLLKEDKADILIKGSVGFRIFSRTLLDRERGIVIPGKVLNSIMVVENIDRDGFVFISGCPTNAALNLPQKLAVVMDTVGLANKFGVVNVRVAALTSSDEISPNDQAAIDAYGLSNMKFRNCVIRGPVTMGNTLTNDAKGRIVPDYDVLFGSEPGMGLMINRAFRLSSGREFAGILSHTQYPVAVSSHVDCVETRYNSILLALLKGKEVQ